MAHVLRHRAVMRCTRAAAAGQRQAPWLALGVVLAGLAGCAGGQVARLPASGVSGSEGGSEETLYYDAAGRPHFQ